MATSLSRFTSDLVERLHKGKCKDCKSCLDYVSVEDGLPVLKCVDWNKNYEKEFDEDLVKRSENT